MIDIYKNKPPRNEYKQLNRYQNKTFIKKIELDIINDFFKKYPKEKRGRKNFKKKEIQNIKALVYEEIFQKAFVIKADCIGSIKEDISNDKIMVTVTFFKKNV